MITGLQQNRVHGIMRAMNEYDNDFPTLSQDEAVEKWQEGRIAWNKWVADNPKYNIDFENVNFSKHKFDFIEDPPVKKITNSNKFSVLKKDDSIFPFSGYNFPEGNISFKGTKFGDHDLSFRNASFKKGELCFYKAKFGDGHISFKDVKFNDAEVSFVGSRFGKGDVSFRRAGFGKGCVDFSFTMFGSMAYFMELENIKEVNSFSFKYASFDGPLDISSEEIFPCLIDLTNIKTTHHFSLHGVKCNLPRDEQRTPKLFPKGDWNTHKVAQDKDDIDRARRLKELAETNKDHHKAQDFHVLEMQAMRKFSKKPPRYLSVPLFKILTKTRFKTIYRYIPTFPYAYLARTEFWFEKLGDYGRSITRPISWFFGIMIAWSFAYAWISGLWVKSFIYSASQMLAFIPASRSARDSMQKALFCKDMPDYIYLFNFTQSLLALILLFLLALAIRHRYRI